MQDKRIDLNYNNSFRYYSTTHSSTLGEKEKSNIFKITMWKERWFLSSNAKDIGTLYLMFALFSGIIGTAFSMLIILELSGPGVQYIQIINYIMHNNCTCYSNDILHGQQ